MTPIEQRRAAPTDTTTRADRTDKLDWCKVAKLAGKHGVNYRTGIGLTMFLMEMFSDEATALERNERIAALEGEVILLKADKAIYEARRDSPLYDRMLDMEKANAALEGEVERLREALVKECEENLWNAYSTGHVKDGLWSHLYLSDGERLARECGFDPTQYEYPDADIRAAIPRAARAALKGTDHDPA